MTKRSTVNIRDIPPAEAPTASGAFMVRGDTLTVQTEERVELTDVTDRLLALVRASGIREGIISLWSMHTTCAVFINEFQTALLTDIKAFLELHIEQGPILETGRLDVGVVTAISGITRIEIIVEGQADHAGTTPMGHRRDALVAA